jgi:hypothetical protein
MRRRCCCAGGEQDVGNGICVPECSSVPYNLQATISASIDGFTRGFPTGLGTFQEDCPSCPGECFARPVYTTWSGITTAVGAYPQTRIYEGYATVDDGIGCTPCERVQVSWTPTSTSKTFTIRGPANPQFPNTGSVVGQSGDGGISVLNPVFVFCRDMSDTCGLAGLWDTFRITVSRLQASPWFEIPNGGYYDDSCGVGPVEDGFATRFEVRSTVTALYGKPVPFAACRSRAGTYRLLRSEGSYEWTNFGHAYHPFCGLPQRVLVTRPAALCGQLCIGQSQPVQVPCCHVFDCPSDHSASWSEVRCGSVPPGYALPATVQVTQA